MSEPLFSIGTGHTVKVPLADNAEYILNFVMASRENPPEEMEDETVLHFCHAVMCVAGGNEPRDDFLERKQYERGDFNRVLISFANIPILQYDDDGKAAYVYKKGLVFCEHTTVPDFIAALYATLNKDARFAEWGIGSATSRTAARSGSSGSNTPATPQPAAPPTPGAFELFRPELEFYLDCPRKADLREKEIARREVEPDVKFGQPFRTNVAQIKVIDDGGNRKYKFYSTYGGMISRHALGEPSDLSFMLHPATLVYLAGLPLGKTPVQLTGAFFARVSDEKKKMPNGEMMHSTYINLNFLDLPRRTVQQKPKAGEESQLPPGGVEDDVPESRGIGAAMMNQETPEDYDVPSGDSDIPSEEFPHYKGDPDDIPF